MKLQFDNLSEINCRGRLCLDIHVCIYLDTRTVVSLNWVGSC